MQSDGKVHGSFSFRVVIASLLVGFVFIEIPAAESNSASSPDLTMGRSPRKDMLVANATFVVFDCETTGLSPTNDRVVEVGAVKFCNGKVIEEKSWLVNPQRHIPPWVVKVHGIDDTMVKNSPTFKEMYPEFIAFIGDSVLMAHNARFDVSFVRAEIERNQLPLPRNMTIDSLYLFRKWFPEAKSHKLKDVADEAKIETKTLHRGMADSMYVFLIFDKALVSKDPRITLSDLYTDCGGPLQF